MFIHSANHDIALSERAFFERRYVYDNVVIGDNSLLSANVSILPGARLMAGSFVACGAVVTRGTYPDGCRIQGVPGKAVAAETEPPAEAPSIALLAPVEGPHRHAAGLLVTSLGLPQVRVFSDGEDLPASVHTVLAIGPEGWRPDTADHLSVWRLADGDRRVAGKVSITIPVSGDDAPTITIPAARCRALAPTFDASRSKSDNARSLSRYYATKRLRKRRGRLTDAERVELYLAVFMLLRLDDPSARDFAEELTGFLPAQTDQATPAQRRACNQFTHPDAQGDTAPALFEAIIELARASDGVRRAASEGAVRQFSDRTYLGCPELLPALALRYNDDANETLTGHIRSLITKATKASQLIHFGLAAALLGHDDLLVQCEQRLYTDQFFDEQSMSVRSAANSTGGCYSPALAVLLMIEEPVRGRCPAPRREEVREQRIEWSVFEGDGTDWLIRSQTQSGLLVDVGRRLISRSMFDNWLMCLRVPAIEGMQHELTADDYLPLAARIEAAWMPLFRHVQHAAGESLVRVRPWPYPCRAAFSLRYDIDRKVRTSQVEEIIQLQARRLNSACATWYAIPGTPFGKTLGETLPRSLQEVGVHLLSCEREMAGRGVTHHSAPGSEHWRGRITIEALEAGGADFGEMLAGQLSRPRPAWIGDHDAGRPTSIWLTPIHFPLEGSTDDGDLTYFDRRLDEFRRLLADGGHVIVGSHPDLNQDLLRQLLDREDLADAWCAPVGMVVQRCRQLMSCGAVSVVGLTENRLSLVARHTIADVRIEIDTPTSGTRVICTQLNAGIPRTLTWG